MPKFIVENTSGDGNQTEIEASDEVEALRTVLAHSSNIASLIREYDDVTDPNGSYRNPGTDRRWKHVTISIGLAPEDDDDED